MAEKTVESMREAVTCEWSSGSCGERMSGENVRYDGSTVCKFVSF